jgi:hypothetical protein
MICLCLPFLERVIEIFWIHFFPMKKNSRVCPISPINSSYRCVTVVMLKTDVTVVMSEN